MRKIDLTALILIIFALVLLVYKLDKPFWGQFDWTGAWFGTIARNLLTIPLAETKLAAITVSGTSNPSDWTFYNHYTSFYPLLIALSMAVFGQTEAAIRLVPIIFSLLTLSAFYLICRKFFHPLVGIFGILAIIFTPMFIYYGKLPVHEQAVLFFSLTALYFYLKRDFTRMTVFLSLGFLTSWTGAYMLFLLTIHLFLTKKWQVFKLLPAYLVVFGITVLHLVHIYISSDLSEFRETLLERTSGGHSPLSFVIKQMKWFFVLYSRPLALVSLALLLISLVKRKAILSIQILLIFFAWGFGQWLVVPRIAWIHDYMLIYFLPFVALATGLVFYKLFRWNKILGLLTIFAIFYISILSHLSFTKALLESKDQTSKLYDLAIIIAQKTKSEEKTLLLAPDAMFEKRYPSHYLSFYANRYVKYSLTKDKISKKPFKLIIIPINDEFTIYD